MENIDVLIKEATKSKDMTRLGVLRLIKTELLKAEKSGKAFDQGRILLKMIDQRKESVRLFKEAGRDDLVSKEEQELDILGEYAPKQATDEEIREETLKILGRHGKSEIGMKDMKRILEEVQKTYPGASGKIVSEELKKFIS